MALTMSKTQSKVSRYMKKQEKFNSYSRTKIKTQKAIIGGTDDPDVGFIRQRFYNMLKDVKENILEWMNK